MSRVRETIRAIKYRIQPRFKFALDANPDYEATIKNLTRSSNNMPELYELRGWVIHPEGVVTLSWYHDDVCLFQVCPWQSRSDVAVAFPFLADAKTSGFTFQIPGTVFTNVRNGSLRLEASTGSNSVVLWSNQNSVTDETDQLKTELLSWVKTQSRKHHFTGAKTKFEVAPDQPIALVGQHSSELPEAIASLALFLNLSAKPFAITPAELASIIPTTIAGQSTRPILTESADLLDTAFLLRYLLGGTVHCLAAEAAKHSLAIQWDTAGVCTDPTQSLPTQSAGVSIIIPVFNALDVSIRCIQSLIPELGTSNECIIVSDASDPYVNQQLQTLAGNQPHITFIERKENGGFIEACYTGIEAARSDTDVILLNSDTVLAPGTIEALKAQMFERKDIAIGSPLSTGSPNFELALAAGEDFFSAAKRLKELQLSRTPTAITPEGQCLYIKRWALERFGFFDRVYGRGFCEESDLAMRMFSMGADIVCLDKTLIHHERSASFGTYQRLKQIQKNRPIFDERWGHSYDLAFAAYALRAPLAEIKKTWRQSPPSVQLDSLEIAFLVPCLITAGGHLSIIQHVNTMLMQGRKAGILCHQEPDTDALGLLTQPILISKQELLEQGSYPENLVATMWTTADCVAKIVKKSTRTRGWYYIQDYEPWFYEKSNQEAERAAARDSYELGLTMVAKTNFLCELVNTLHNKPVHKICPGIARTIFYPGNQTTYTGPPRLTALYRPDKPRRGTTLLLDTLDELLLRNDSVEIYLFGSSDIEPCNPALRKKIHFLGALSSNKVAELYRASDVVCDLSLWHGFGRMGIEAMACGAVPVLSEAGGIAEYARHGENALIVPDDPEQIAITLNTVLQDAVYRQSLRAAGLATFSWSEDQATSDWLALIDTKTSQEEAA